MVLRADVGPKRTDPVWTLLACFWLDWMFSVLPASHHHRQSSSLIDVWQMCVLGGGVGVRNEENWGQLT